MAFARMMIQLMVSAIFFGAISSASPTPVKRFSVNLDLPPENRWNEIAILYKDNIQTMWTFVEKRIPKDAVPLLEELAADLDNYLPYAGELKGLARSANMSLGAIVMANILYDVTAFCTSIVMENNNGSIFHGRNLDYSLGKEMLSALTIVVDFQQSGKTVYTATTYAGYVGILTGMKPHAFTITVDERDQGSLWQNLLAAILEGKNAIPMSFLVRKTFDEENTFDGAVAKLGATPLIAPVYYIIGGTRPGQGAIITRDRMSARDIYNLDTENGRWYVLETNYDHWTTPPGSDDRRDPAAAVLDEGGRSKASIDLLLKVLNTPPVLNKKTTYTTVMSAGQPNLYEAWKQDEK